MATLSQIQSDKLKLPVFVRALSVERRLTDAIETCSFNIARLKNLRRQLRWEINNANEQSMTLWLATYMQSIEHHIDCAENVSGWREEAIARPAHYGLGEAA